MKNISDGNIGLNPNTIYNVDSVKWKFIQMILLLKIPSMTEIVAVGNVFFFEKNDFIKINYGTSA